jgi:hypothetical protein
VKRAEALIPPPTSRFESALLASGLPLGPIVDGMRGSVVVPIQDADLDPLGPGGRRLRGRDRPDETEGQHQQDEQSTTGTRATVAAGPVGL